MSEEASALVPPKVELDQVLLDAKRSVPDPPSRGSVSRAALIESARSSGCRMVSVAAPAGYGKSTLLAEWAHAEKRPVAWVSIDRFDDDPAALLTLIASAFAGSMPGMERLTDDVRGHGVSALGRGAPLLASVLRAAPEPFVLMIDDLHELRSAACHDVLGVVLVGVPRGSQVVVASRGEPPEVPRFRAAADAFEISVAELALDVDGAAAIFAEARVPLSEQHATEVVERTEGWPVGLHLAASIARESGDDALAVSGDDRFVADYLYREALVKLPVHVQRFLRRTAVLDTFSAPLCEVLVAAGDAQEVLRELEDFSVFLVPLDRRREWFRYHALFREFLLGELRRVEPDAMVALHVAAADWFEQNGSPAMAIEHLLEISTERERATQLVASVTLATYQAGQLSTLQRWLGELGDPAIEAYPPLAVLAGLITALTGQVHEADRWAAVLDAASYDGTPVDGTASFESGRAIFRSMVCSAGPTRAMADAMFLLESEPTWSPWHDQALFFLGEAHLLMGETAEARAAFAECSSGAAPRDNTDVLIASESELASLAMDGGRWVEAAEHVETALAAVERRRMHDYVAAVMAFTEAARLAVHRGDQGEARVQLTRAMRARPTCTYAVPNIAVRVRLHLAKVYWSVMEPTTARHLLREIDDLLLHRPDLGTLVQEVSDFRSIVSTADHTRSAGGPPLTPAELRLLPYLQTHLSFREIGERLFISRNTVSSEVNSIYRKMGAASRSEAVERATTIGLLGG